MKRTQLPVLFLLMLFLGFFNSVQAQEANRIAREVSDRFDSGLAI